jgi:hypothetical protein
MTLCEKVEKAFTHRQVPSEAVAHEQYLQFDSDVEDALWFTGRNWHDITLKDWERYNCGIYFLSPEAFAYYLPSLIVLSIQSPTDSLLSVDSVLHLLDRSPDMNGWDDHFSERFLGFTSDEYEVIKEWLLFLAEYGKDYGLVTTGPGDTFGRAFETIYLLQKESERRKLLTK